MMKAVNDSNIENCLLSYLVHSPSITYMINSVVSCVVDAIFAVVGILLNSFVLFTFWKSTKLKKKIAYFLIMVLSSIDLGVGLIVQPLYLVQSVAEIRGTPDCLHRTAYFGIVIPFSRTIHNGSFNFEY